MTWLSSVLEWLFALPTWVWLVLWIGAVVLGVWLEERKRNHWWAWYTSYLHSPAWQQRRRAILQRDHYVCQQCHRARAVQVHHLTYKRVGHEHPSDLVSLCYRCHQARHGK